MSYPQHVNMKLCPSCNAPLSDGAHFCGGCGHRLSAETGTYPTSAKTIPSTPLPSRVHRRLALSSMLSTLVIIVLAAGLGLETLNIIPHLSLINRPITSYNANTPHASHTTSATPGILYTENGSDNWHGWDGNLWYTQDGMLYSRNTDNNARIDPTIISPFSISSTDDYTVETQLRVINWSPWDGNLKDWTSAFGITFRGTPATQSNPWTGYMLQCFNTDYYHNPPTAYIGNNKATIAGSTLASKQYDPGYNRHTYLIKVKGDHIDVSIDGSPFLTAQNEEFPHGGQVGFWATNIALVITSFTITTP